MRVVGERVSKVFGDRAGHAVRALDGIDLVVNTEELVAVLGPSGCGKSTLLNLIAGLLAPTEGAIWLDGELPPGRAATAMVFQEFALFPWRTVQANVEFGLEEMGVSRAERARRALHAGNLMQTTKLMVGIVVLSILGVLSHWSLGRLERLAIPWRASA